MGKNDHPESRQSSPSSSGRQQARPATDHLSWTQVFSSREGWLLGYFRKRLARPSDARDLVQEVYLRLLHVDCGEGNSIVDPEAYLFTVAANLVKEEAILHRRDVLHVALADVFPEIESDHDAAEEVLERQHRERRLADAVARLPPRHRAVILMQYREHMSYADIAERLGVSTHMVKKYVVQALAACRRELAGLR